MSKPILKVENLSKQYRLGNVGTGSLVHDVNRWWHTVRGKEDPYLTIGEANDRTVKGGSDYVWALQDINFEVQQGEVLGIVGKNGAGKSTLLKLLSRVTAPTTGKITAYGRIASLLEVGTGFHPELTGRENIFLNGAILGMTKPEIRSKFDEIVDFAGCERYIDTPVKRYSSGMYVRLAFAVAAHLEPEILIVDEVLAVGDAEFQKKAIGKMKEVSQGQGRTVLFVSHNMASVKSLCTSAILLENGKVAIPKNTPDYIIDKYVRGNQVDDFKNISEQVDRKGNGKLLFQDCILTQVKGSTHNSIKLGESCEFIIKIKNTTSIDYSSINLSISLKNMHGDPVTNFNNYATGEILSIKANETKEFSVKIQGLNLYPNTYYFGLYSELNGEMTDWIGNAGRIEIIENDFFNSGRLIPKGQGAILIKHSFLG
ncbi:ABC transporter ATP-binding protein [Mangrovimonas sp. TPBH4]|uniref:ABC transporter ATP-binding protein n=1 Tax=Mangrovimonas sp. TPBH4 TaxID=1645914 RepID=UPI0006B5839E|nr:ABC transporter ATP-binding protein [Mangrovimonas sp. TPBH4]